MKQMRILILKINLSGTQIFELEIYVGNQPNSCILGMDFLERNCYIITRDFIIINDIIHKRFKNSEWEILKYINGN